MRLTLLTIVMTATCTLLSTATLAKGPKVPYNHVGMTDIDRSHESEVNMVSIQDIENTLAGKPPMTVGFDIDDTALFSSPCFYYGKQKWSPNDYGFLHNQKFWDYVADNCDLNSIPKASVRKLIDMHNKRGDKIIFITGRTPHSGHKDGSIDSLATLLQKTFNISKMSPIYYTRDTIKAPYQYDKTPYLKEADVKILYGDSDSDILAAREAGIRGIRIIRAANSTNQPLPLNGGYGEEVVKNSWY